MGVGERFVILGRGGGGGLEEEKRGGRKKKPNPIALGGFGIIHRSSSISSKIEEIVVAIIESERQRIRMYVGYVGYVGL